MTNTTEWITRSVSRLRSVAPAPDKAPKAAKAAIDKHATDGAAKAPAPRSTHERLQATLSPQGFSLSLTVEVGYSSTCPCSAALARQLLADGFGADAAAAGSAGPAGRAGLGSIRVPGCFRMLLSGMSRGGARSLNTLRPSLSIHCHWAEAPSDQVQANASSTSL